eukprot:2587786-Alexandrium_andersonii.AAC.1
MTGRRNTRRPRAVGDGHAPSIYNAPPSPAPDGLARGDEPLKHSSEPLPKDLEPTRPSEEGVRPALRTRPCRRRRKSAWSSAAWPKDP